MTPQDMRERAAQLLDDYEKGMAGRLCCAGQRHHLAAAIRAIPIPEPTGDEREAINAILKHCEENPKMLDCPRCNGRGFHHGFGEDGNDPDWCSECGGAQCIGDPNQVADALLAQGWKRTVVE